MRGLRKTDYAMTLEEIALIEGVTRERIRKIEAGALKKLRKQGITLRILKQFSDDKDVRNYARAARRNMGKGPEA